MRASNKSVDREWERGKATLLLCCHQPGLDHPHLWPGTPRQTHSHSLWLPTSSPQRSQKDINTQLRSHDPITKPLHWLPKVLKYIPIPLFCCFTWPEPCKPIAFLLPYFPSRHYIPTTLAIHQFLAQTKRDPFPSKVDHTLLVSFVSVVILWTYFTYWPLLCVWVWQTQQSVSSKVERIVFSYCMPSSFHCAWNLIGTQAIFLEWMMAYQ